MKKACAERIQAFGARFTFSIINRQENLFFDALFSLYLRGKYIYEVTYVGIRID